MLASQSLRQGWKPLLSGCLADRALLIARKIASSLHPFVPAGHRHHPEARISLAEGRTGASIFFLYLDGALPDRGYREIAIELLDEAIADLEGITSQPDLYSGFVGVAWALEHFQKYILDIKNDLGLETAVALQRFLHRSPLVPFDLTTGLVGIGIYALERYPRPGAADCLQHIIRQLKTSA